MKQEMKILIAESDGFPPDAVSLLSEYGEVAQTNLDTAGLWREIAAADVLWVRLRNRIDAKLMAAAPGLKIIASPTTGLNHIDTDEAKRQGIEVISLRNESAFLRDIRATAELTIALILALLRNLPAASRHVREGGWDRDLFKGRELYGMTAGVVGYGRLGRIVARYLRAFDVDVLAADPFVPEDQVEPGVRLVPLPELLAASDLVTLHVNLTHETEGVFGAAEFARMKPGAWFINTARGELIDEAALLEALRSGRLAGAAVDVLTGEQEGVADNRLAAWVREHDNLIVTPHIGGCTGESMKKTEIFLARRVCASLAARRKAAAGRESEH